MPMYLKPCPLCGNEANLFYDEKTNCFSVFCSYCNANIDGYYVYEGAIRDTMKKVIEDWNGRFENDRNKNIL